MSANFFGESEEHMKHKKTTEKGNKKDVAAKYLHVLVEENHVLVEENARLKHDLKIAVKKMKDSDNLFSESMNQLEKSRKANSSIHKRLESLQNILAIRFEVFDIDLSSKFIWIKLHETDENQILNLQNCFDRIFNDICVIVTDNTIDSIRELDIEELRELVKNVS